jgi:PAT family beta-lactamase induction signal transducer AmpG
MSDAAARQGFFGALAEYLKPAPLAALALGISSGFPFTMIAATLASWLADENIDIKAVTAFALVLLPYNAKFLWAWIIEGVRIPLLHRLGRRVSWMIVAGLLVIAAVVNLAMHPPSEGLAATAFAALLVGIAGATYDIVIDGYRIELLAPEQLGIGSGMSQYGWRIGNGVAGALALILAEAYDWPTAYIACSAFALFGMVTALVMGEPAREPAEVKRAGGPGLVQSIVGPFLDFFTRSGAWLVLAFILIHKIGDTLANLTLRPFFKELGFTKTEIAVYDVGIGWWALMIGIFVGGVVYARLGMKRAVFVSLLLMAVSNLSFAGLAVVGHDVWAMAAAVGFENFASGIGGVAVVAYFSALCDLRFTAAQFALISAAASVAGRVLTALSAGDLIKFVGFVDFYLLTTVAALPGIALYWWMLRTGFVDESIGRPA